MKKKILFMLMIGILGVSGCVPQNGLDPSGEIRALETETAAAASPTDQPAPGPTPEFTVETPGEADDMTRIDPNLTPFVQQSLQDLAVRLEIPEEAIEVLRAEAVIWPDAGLGCPQPGMLYKQVQVDGFFIQLEVDGKLFNYHGGGSRGPFLCEQPGKSSPPDNSSPPLDQ